jgi:pimeloyl-[acyl-carrier protein] methyl ester esterase
VSYPTIVLLPGLDGTADLFTSFVAAAPGGLQLQPVPLPASSPQRYVRLATQIEAVLPSGPIVLVAESFSGPLAILLARQVRAVVGVVLCASFARAPAPVAFGYLPSWAWRARPPKALVRAFMTGGSIQLANAVVSAVSSVDSAVIAERLAEVLRVNVTEELAELTMPVLYVRATRDRLIGVKSAEQIRLARPSTRIVEVNAPHLMLQANPRDAWKCIQPFIEEVNTSERARAG